MLAGAYALAGLAGAGLVLVGAGGGGEPGWVKATGGALGVLVFSLVSLQFLLSSRFHWMERPWGLDRLLWLHRRMGLVIGLLVLLHPALLAVALSARGGVREGELSQHFGHWGVWLGVVAAGALLVQIVTTYFAEEIGLSYERWRAVHNVVAVVVLAGFAHAWAVGPHVYGASVVTAGLAAGLVVSVGVVVYRRFVKPRTLPRYRVTEVLQETHDTWTLWMAPTRGEVLDYLPGQFIFLTLYREGFPAEEHPFTISSSPTRRGAIAVTPKAVGDFTSTIGLTKPGDTALIDGPYGRFTYLRVAHRPLLLISGGVGITPFASYLRHLRDTDARTDVVLIDANETQADIIFRRELDDLEAACPHVRIVYVLSGPEPDWTGERGYVDEDLLRRCVPDLGRRVVFLCGPPQMMTLARGALVGLGVPRSRIRTEEFKLK